MTIYLPLINDVSNMSFRHVFWSTGSSSSNDWLP